MEKLRVVAYCRVSTDKDDQKNSFQSQQDYFSEYISRHEGWVLTKIYPDEGITGTSTKKRKQFNQMIIDAKNHQFDLILTKEVSRFARNTVDTLQYTRELKVRGIGVVFSLDGISTLDSDGELRLTIMASLAQEESRRTSERVKWGQKRRMEKGIVFGRELLGYNLNKGILSINECEADIVRLIFHKFLNEGKGTHVIARELYETNIRPKRVKEWSNTVILRVLRNEKYVGDLCQKKTYTPDFLTHEKKYNRGQEEMVYIENHHNAIIDRRTWERVQEELSRRAPTPEQKAKHSNRYWCSGKVHCGECGSTFVSKKKKLMNGSPYKAWVCHENQKHGAQKMDSFGNSRGCGMPSINEITLQKCVIFAFGYINDCKEEIIRELTGEITALKCKQQEPIYISDIEKRIQQINQKKIEVIQLQVEGLISKEDMVITNEKYDSEMRQCQEKILSAHQQSHEKSSALQKLDLCIERVRELAAMDATEFTYEAYSKILDSICMKKDNIMEIRFKGFPKTITLQYSTFGRCDNFTVTCEVI